MKKIILIILTFFLFASLVSAQLCEYNGIKTKIYKKHQIDYPDEDFIRIEDTKVITKVDQLKGLTCLQYADFGNPSGEEGISGDIADLKDLTDLVVFSLHSNPNVYGDICVFDKMTKLRVLKFAFDPDVYGDISCLKDLNLDNFAMTYVGITGELSSLSHMTNLKELYLSGTEVSGDISAISVLTNLEELTISDTDTGESFIYGDLATLDNLQKLRRVALYSDNLTNCKHFTAMHPNLEQGGCSPESIGTTDNPNVVVEKRIGVYRGNVTDNNTNPKNLHEEPGSKDESFFKKLIDWFRNLFG